MSRAEKLRHGTVRHDMAKCSKCGVWVEDHARMNHLQWQHEKDIDRFLGRIFKLKRTG